MSTSGHLKWYIYSSNKKYLNICIIFKNIPSTFTSIFFTCSPLKKNIKFWQNGDADERAVREVKKKKKLIKKFQRKPGTLTTFCLLVSYFVIVSRLIEHFWTEHVSEILFNLTNTNWSSVLDIVLGGRYTNLNKDWNFPFLLLSSFATSIHAHGSAWWSGLGTSVRVTPLPGTASAPAAVGLCASRYPRKNLHRRTHFLFLH